MVNKGVKFVIAVNGGIGNQLFHLSNAFSFYKKYNGKVILNLRGCDSANTPGGSWHLKEFEKYLKRNFHMKINRSRNEIESSILKFKEFYMNLDYPKNFDVEEIFLRTRKFESNIFIPTLENREIAKYALKNNFKKFLIERRNELITAGKLVFSRENDAVAIHFRRLNNDTSTFNIESWYLKIGWYLKAIKYLGFKPSKIYCFTNSIEDGEHLRKFIPNLIVIGTELSPLHTVFSISMFKNQILSRSSLSFWAGAISNPSCVISALKEKENFSPLIKFRYLPAE